VPARLGVVKVLEGHNTNLNLGTKSANLCTSTGFWASALRSPKFLIYSNHLDYKEYANLISFGMLRAWCFSGVAPAPGLAGVLRRTQSAVGEAQENSQDHVRAEVIGAHVQHIWRHHSA
jgi:hypothetical protein